MTTPLVALQAIRKSFGGVHAVHDVHMNLHAGEVLAVLGHNGAGKSTLMKILSGAIPLDSGAILINGLPVMFSSTAQSQSQGIETIYQSLALADNLDAVANLFLGRELRSRWGTLDEDRMEAEALKVFSRLNKRFTNIHVPVRQLSGGQRQIIAIARAIYFNARILIMDEPCAALGPEESSMVGRLIVELREHGVGIFLISHDLADVFRLSDRLTVMKNGAAIGCYNTREVSEDDVLGMIIAGKKPAGTPEAHRAEA